MRNDLRASKYTIPQRIGIACIAAVVIWFAWLALHDPYSGDFATPKTVSQVTHRIGFGVKRVAGEAESSIQETNASMQGTVDGRNELNDSRIERDSP